MNSPMPVENCASLSRAACIGLWRIDHSHVVFESAMTSDAEPLTELGLLQGLAEQAARKQAPQIRSLQPRDDIRLFLLAIPVVHHDRTRSVVGFVLGEPVVRGSALERWELVEDRAELSLTDGCYGELNYFQEISREVRFPLGTGLPGMTWKTGVPRLLHPLATSPEFLRAGEAGEAGLEIGIGFPILGEGSEVQSVLLLLSSSGISFASEFQIWTESAGRCTQTDRLIVEQSPVANANEQKMLDGVIEDLVLEAFARKTAIVERIPAPSGRETGLVVLPVLYDFGISSALVLVMNGK